VRPWEVAGTAAEASTEAIEVEEWELSPARRLQASERTS
jgi:hypothetical protein